MDSDVPRYVRRAFGGADEHSRRSPLRACVVCGTNLAGRRADARHCGGPCRAEASRLRRILAGREVGPYQSIQARMAARRRTGK
jgi:hypothetical protein